ncbi:Mus7/MMS22 family-domain-containing protein, partial [Amylocystis lapponica]
PAQEAEQAPGRYSLRTRQAKQVKPYAFDKLAYKRQLRGIPDAIVSPLRVRRHGSPRRRSGSGSAGEEEFADEEGERDDDDDDREWRKRKSRSASVGARARRRSSSAKDAADERAGSPRQTAPSVKWCPPAFADTFSSSEDDDLGDLLLPKEGEPSTEGAPRAKLRRKPFPMRRKLHKTPSPKPPRASSVGSLSIRGLVLSDGSVPQSPVQRPSPSGHLVNGESDADDDDDPIPTWRRRKSSTVSLLRSPSNSPPIFPRAPSPEVPVFEDYDGFDPPVPSTPADLLLSQSEPHSTSTGEDDRAASESDVEIVEEAPRRLHRRSSSPVHSSSSSESHMRALDRKRKKALSRMMPAVMANKHLKDAAQLPRRRAVQASDNDSDTGQADRPLLPGQSKVLRRDHSSRTPIEVCGDSESEDDPGAYGFSSSGSEMDFVAGPSRPRVDVDLSRASDAEIEIEIDSKDGDGYVGEDEVGQWVEHSAVRRRKTDRADEAKEGDLIDRMLSRTDVTARRRKPARRRRRTGADGGARHGGPSGTRKTGTRRQTLLPYARRSDAAAPERHGDAQSMPIFPCRNHVQVGQASTERAETKRKRKRDAHNEHLYVFDAGNTHITSGRSHALPITIDAEDEAPRPILQDYVDERPRPVSRRRHKPTVHRSASGVEPTLHDFWPEDGNENTIDEIAKGLHKMPTHDNDAVLRRRLTIDFSIPFMPSGIIFGPTTYLAHGWLHELITLFSGDQDILEPVSCYLFEAHLHSAMSVQDFSIVLERTCDRLQDFIVQGKDISTDECHHWQVLLHSICQHSSWLFGKAGEEDYVSLHVAIEKSVGRLSSVLEEPTEIILEDESPSQLAFEARWFLVELMYRIECHRRKRHSQMDDAMILVHSKRLMRHMLQYGFERTMEPLVHRDEAGLDLPSLSQRTAELWVCLIHTLGSWVTSVAAGPGHQISIRSFWDVYIQSIRMEGASILTASDLTASETIWRSVFSLCALSQFSVHGMTTSSPRLSASWQLVVIALERIRLAAEPTADAKLTPGSLHRRDEYIRILVSRCLVLTHQWRWQLDDASLMFNRLLDIFKSRRFANLSHEPSDFPSFLRYNNLQLLSRHRRSDSAFTTFLKLIVQAEKETKGTEENQRVGLAPKVKKLLSLSVPVGSVPFTKATPPTGEELSMLYNRFSAVAVAIYLEPTPTNVKYRMAHARRYVNFRDTDHETRRSCIRGLMHLTILLRHLRLSLDDVLDWLAEMTNVLVDEYRDAEIVANKTPSTSTTTHCIVLCIEMLLGCVRRVIETPVMEPGQTSTPYPDPVLLQGPWVTRVFSHQTKLTGEKSSRVEIRRLVQAFLDARAAVIPRPPRPSLVTEDSQESQEEYGRFDLTMDDPQLLLSLGLEAESVQAKENKKNQEKDKLISETIDTNITPAIYRLVCKHFHDTGVEGTLEQFSNDADRWIDCWAGCASVVVQNGRRDWSLYMTMGPQSWERIIDTSWRRRVGLRFMFMLLQLDPSAYPLYKERFVDVMMENIVTAKVTIEHEYVCLLFSIDGLRHPLFHGVPCEPIEDSPDFKMSKTDFLDKRLSILETIFTNLAISLDREVDGEMTLIGLNQSCIGSLITMLSTMQDVHQQFKVGSEDRLKYTSFCQQVAERLFQHGTLKNNTRLSSLLDWAHHLS